MPKQKKFVIIDTFSLLHRAWHALPPSLTTADGRMVNAAYGFTSILLKLMNDLKPDYLMAAFDLAAPTFRHEEFVQYKAQRETQPDELYDQVVIVEEILDAFKIPRLSKKGFEADDIIGTVVKYNRQHNPELKNIIVTGDLDALQLVDSQTEVFTLKKGINDTVIYTPSAVKERYGLKPDQLIDMKALKGDASDNIPGVKGIGEKGASDLIKEFKSLDNLYKNIDSDKIKDRVRQLLLEQKKEAYQSQRLVTIVTDLPITFALNEAETHSFDKEKIYQLFKELQFNSLVNKIPKTNGGQQNLLTAMPQTNDDYQTVSGTPAMEKLLEELKDHKIFAIDTETTGLNTMEAEILGVSLSWQAKHGYYISLRTKKDRDSFVKLFKKLLEDPDYQKIGHNIKYDFQILKKLGITMQGVFFDTMIAAFLLNPGRGLKLEELAFSYFGRRMLKLSDIAAQESKIIDMLAIPEAKLSWYAAEDADYTWQLYKKMEPEIAKSDLKKMMYEIEMPLVPVLAEMELQGIAIDKEQLKKMSKSFALRITKISEKIYKMAGKEFNISSPLQLKEILFDTLEIDTKGLKKTKTGISTAASELDKMTGRHEIIPLISEYRELTKLQSTYIKALPKLASPIDQRIHTSFNQTVTATGRLSSNDPNLQNIPIRTELGREIRQAFISKRGYKLISADYSQIELRVAAHMSQDPAMTQSFLKGEDIHTATAAAVNKVTLDKVTPTMRRQAKEVNFGVLYGLGARGLSQRTDLNQEEAKEFIEKYFRVYQGLKKYIEETKKRVHQLGYVETMFGRRRGLPEIYSTMPQLVAQAERMAVNMPLQGTAADIIKLAMIAIQEKLPKNSHDSKMLLQVHDELVFEVPNEDVEKVTKFVKQQMEKVTKLTVPLIVDVKVGNNWSEMSAA